MCLVSQDVTNDFTFLIFCVLLLFFVGFTFLCVPETKNLTFEEIAHKFSPGDAIEVQTVDYADGPESQKLEGQCAVVNFPPDPSTPPMTERLVTGGLGASEDGVELQSFRTVDTKF